MQVLCKVTSSAADVCCSVCGQGFALYWERQNKIERAQALSEVAKTLRSHHRDKSGPEAHPQRGFLVPEFRGPASDSGAAVLGSAPSWAL
jgi:hypothetical protein